MAHDRLAYPIEQPDQPTSNAPASPRSTEKLAGPVEAECLTRAQAFESVRTRIAAEDSGSPLVDQHDGTPDYWGEVARFRAAWSKIAECLPLEQQPVERPTPSSGGVERREHRQVLEKITETERAVSADIKNVEANAENGGVLVGFEFRLKAVERLSEKVAERIRREPERAPREILSSVHDAIRYTFCFPKESYSAGCEDIKVGLESLGYEMYHRKNLWSDPEYKGLNTRWVTPGGQRFEVQFHTEESFHAKHDMTHRAYERLRQPGVGPYERRELMDFQKLVSSYVPIPDGVQNISNFDRAPVD
jgi:hypothetical protein